MFPADRNTHKAAEDLVTRLHRDWAPIVIDGHCRGGLAVRAERAVEPNPFHAVMQETIVCLRRVEFRYPVYFR